MRKLLIPLLLIYYYSVAQQKFEFIANLEGPVGTQISAVAIQDTIAAVAYCDMSVRVYAVQTGQQLYELSGHTQSITAIAIGSDIIGTASWDMTVRIYHRETGRFLYKFTHTEPINLLSIKEDVIITATQRYIYIYNRENNDALDIENLLPEELLLTELEVKAVYEFGLYEGHFEAVASNDDIIVTGYFNTRDNKYYLGICTIKNKDFCSYRLADLPYKQPNTCIRKIDIEQSYIIFHYNTGEKIRFYQDDLQNNCSQVFHILPEGQLKQVVIIDSIKDFVILRYNGRLTLYNKADQSFLPIAADSVTCVDDSNIIALNAGNNTSLYALL